MPSNSADRRSRIRIVLSAVVSLTAWILVQATVPRPDIPWTREMLDASDRMARATATITRFCEAEGIPVDESLDPNRTCLIGPEYTPLFTTLGQLEAKRTTTNPDVAGLLVHLLNEAGASAGDTIAVGASGSFPALLIATLTAAEAMDVVPVTVISLGSSSYGATRPELNLLRIHTLLVTEGLLASLPAAVSLGGENDIGSDFEAATREELLQQIGASGLPLLSESELSENVKQRFTIYHNTATDAAKVFVNIGGSDANLGTSPLVLQVTPGLNTDLTLPAADGRGVLFEMAARDIPVIHLLHIRGFAQRYGLPWDPIPLPAPGSTVLQSSPTSAAASFWIITMGYLTSLGLIVLVGRGRSRDQA